MDTKVRQIVVMFLARACKEEGDDGANWHRVESLGGTQESFYWMQGRHDGFLIATLPDGVAAAAIAAAVGSTGAVVDIETHEIFDHVQQATIVSQARTALGAYKPPTA